MFILTQVIIDLGLWKEYRIASEKLGGSVHKCDSECVLMGCAISQHIHERNILHQVREQIAHPKREAS